MMKIAIDLDQYIDDQQFFRVMCHLLLPEHEIHIITNRDEESRDETMKELGRHEIQYSKLAFVGNKIRYLEEQGIEIEIN